MTELRENFYGFEIAPTLKNMNICREITGSYFYSFENHFPLKNTLLSEPLIAIFRSDASNLKEQIVWLQMQPFSWTDWK